MKKGFQCTDPIWTSPPKNENCFGKVAKDSKESMRSLNIWKVRSTRFSFELCLADTADVQSVLRVRESVSNPKLVMLKLVVYPCTNL